MKIAKLLLSLSLFLGSILLAGDKEDIINQIITENEYSNKNNKTMDIYSKEGALEFWSSGGLLNEVGTEDRTNEFESFEQLSLALEAWIKDYNTNYLHSTLGYVPPNVFEQRWLDQQLSSPLIAA